MRAALEPHFEFQSFPLPNEGERASHRALFLRELATQVKRRAIGLYAGSNAPGPAYYLLKLRPDADPEKLLPGVSLLQRELDVVLLHRAILEEKQTLLGWRDVPIEPQQLVTRKCGR